jgi:hypothetical protein
MLFYAVSLRWAGTRILDPTTLSSGANSIMPCTWLSHCDVTFVLFYFRAFDLRRCIVAQSLFSTGALHLSLLSMFLPGNPFSRSIFTRSDTGERQKPHPFEFFKAPINTIVSSAGHPR